MDSYDKNVDKALNAVERVGGVMNRAFRRNEPISD